MHDLRFPARRLLAAAFAIAALAAAAHADGIVPGHILVRVQPGVDPNVVAASYGSRVLDSVSGLSIYSLKVPGGTTETAFVALLSRDKRLVYAEPDTYVKGPEFRGGQLHFSFDTGPDPKGYLNQFALAQIDLRNSPYTGKGVIVAVLDTGATFSHPALTGHYLPGWNAVQPGQPATEMLDGVTNAAMGHGTMVAGIVARVAPGAKLLPVRVLNADGVGTMLQVAQGVRYALSQGARILNMSMSCESLTSVMKDTLDAVELSNAVLVASAGNENSNVPPYPAAHRGAISVAALEVNNVKAPYSNYGSWVKLCAPGSGISSTNYTGGYALASGTSFAAPFVAGAAALMLEERPTADPRTLKESLLNTARSVDSLNPLYKGKLGKGILDIAAAVTKLPTL